MTEFDKVIPPGGVGKVTASVSTTHYRGRVSKGITVTTNDPAQRTFTLQLSAEVKPALFVSPENPFLQGRAKDLKPIEVTLVSANGKPFDVTRVIADPRVIVSVTSANGKQAGRPKRSDPANDDAAPIATGSSRYRVTVAAKPDVSVGKSSAMVTFLTTHPSTPRLAMRVGLVVQGELEVAPERVALHAEQIVQHVKIRKVDGKGLALTAVESSDPDVQVSSAAETKGRAYDVTVRYVGKPGRGPLNARVTVKTNEPSQREIVIPVIGNF